MAASPQAAGASPFSNQSSKPATLGHSTIIWLVILACILAVASVVVACLLCRCRRKNKNGRVSRGYSVHDGRNDYHPWNRHAAPTHTVPPPTYGEYGDFKSKADYQTSIVVPLPAARKPSVVMEPTVVEEAGNEAGFRRSNKKTSRYYGGLSARFSKMSRIGRAI
jgi:hypothetical protein